MMLVSSENATVPTSLPALLTMRAASMPAMLAMRQKCAGIWQDWSCRDYLNRTIAVARRLQQHSLAPNSLVAVVGENRPELYASILAIQALGLIPVPLNGEFLRRYGPPSMPIEFVVCETTDTLRQTWFQASQIEYLTLAQMQTEDMMQPASDKDLRWFQDCVESQSRDSIAVILHTAGSHAMPQAVRLSQGQLIDQGNAANCLMRLGQADRLMAYLPLSGIADFALSVVQPLLAGYRVYCVEGPASIPTDMLDIQPTCLVAPARALELLMGDVEYKLAMSGTLSKFLKTHTSTDSWIGRHLFNRPLLRNMGLNECRTMWVYGDVLSPSVEHQFRDYGVAIQPVAMSTMVGGFLPMPDGALISQDDAMLESDVSGEPIRPELAWLAALLRSTPEIARASVSLQHKTYIAALALNGAVIARFLEKHGIVLGAEAVASVPAIRTLVQQRIDDINQQLSVQAEGLAIHEFHIIEGGFSRHQLTLDGVVRQTITTNTAQTTFAQEGDTDNDARQIGSTLLRVDGIAVAFGGIKALTNVSMEVRTGEILSIIGPNGAGKTSLLNVLNGVYHPKAGTILFQGRERTRLRLRQAARSGIGRTFQHVSLFPGLSVLDNVMTGRAAKFSATFLSKLLRLPSAVGEETQQRIAVEKILEFLDLQHLRRSSVGTLPYGVQKRVELARALATEPVLLLLDEPMAGMTYEEKQDMCRYIRATNRAFGTTVLLIEHDIGVVMGLSDRVVVLNYGCKIADGTPAEVQDNPEVISAYLGSPDVQTDAIKEPS